MKRNKYRYRYSFEDCREEFLKFKPNGTMVGISIQEQPGFGEHITFFTTNEFYPLKTEAFLKHSEVISKAKFDKEMAKFKKLITKA